MEGAREKNVPVLADRCRLDIEAIRDRIGVFPDRAPHEIPAIRRALAGELGARSIKAKRAWKVDRRRSFRLDDGVESARPSDQERIRRDVLDRTNAVAAFLLQDESAVVRRLTGA